MDFFVLYWEEQNRKGEKNVMCIVEVISKDKKKSMEVCKLLELEGYETCMCESEKQIKASFSKFNNIRMFVLILQNARGDDVEDFVKFKENFLPYISNDKKIIISDKGFSGSVTMEQFKKMENKIIPDNINYDEIKSLRIEAKQKLNAMRPLSIGQASRISGVSPADISVLLVYLESSGSNHL